MKDIILGKIHNIIKAILIAAISFAIFGCGKGVISPSDLIEYAKRGNIAKVKTAVDADKSLANLKRDDGVPLIAFAATNGHSDIVAYLLDMGAIDLGNSLHWAVEQEHLDVIKLLLNRKADVNLKGSLQQTPLHYTTQNQNPNIAELLIAAGADVSATDYYGRTPLHRCKSQAVAKVLIATGANVNAKDYNGYTPLHWAGTPREIVDKATIEYLLSHGADTNSKDNTGLTPRQLAMKNGQKALIAILDAYTTRTKMKTAKQESF